MDIFAVKSRYGFLVQFGILLTLGLISLMLFTACSPAEEETPAPTDPAVPATATALPPTATADPSPSKVTPSLDTATQAREVDYWPTAGWQSSTPEEQGMDSEKLAKLFDYIQEQNLNINSVTIIRNGYLVADAAIYPFDIDSKHNLMSVTKSVISALIGIAIDQGFIEGVNQPVLSFFPDREVANIDADKEAMTLEDVLMMATGLECRDSWRYRWRGLERMMQSDDWVQHVLDLPMLEAPGTRFEYCNGASLLLSAIIQETSGLTAAEFADLYLFGPLGIEDVVWPANPQGISLGHADLRLQPHDLAKIGYLFLQKGQWDNHEIMSTSWTTTSTSEHIPALGEHYGYQWWIDPDGLYFARGFGGQYIFVAPDSELVAVFTSNLNEDQIPIPQVLMDVFVIPALISPEALPPNPDGLEQLESSIEAAVLPPTALEPVAPLPEMAQQVSGNTYLFDTPNPADLASISLNFDEGAEALMKLEYVTGDAPLNGEDSPALFQVEMPVGLDNLYRFLPADFGMKMGVKGEWVAEDVFLVHLDFIGNTGLQRAQFTFEGDEISIEFWDDIPSPPVHVPGIIGRLAD